MPAEGGFSFANFLTDVFQCSSSLYGSAYSSWSLATYSDDTTSPAGAKPYG